MVCNNCSGSKAKMRARLSTRLSSCRAALLLLVLLVLAGCEDQTLYQGLTEQEANEMAALLQRSGITATKVAGKENLFSVSTDEESFADAVQLLQANGLPRTKFATLGDIFEEQSFVSSSTAQRARYIHGLSQEISHTISSIDGVLLARVHLSVPEKDPLSDEPPESSASVFVKHRRNIDLSPHVGQIKALVVNGLENLPYENVTVALFESSPDQRLVGDSAGSTGSNSAAKNVQMQMGSVYGLAILVFGVFVMAVYSLLFRKSRKSRKSKSKSLTP